MKIEVIKEKENVSMILKSKNLLKQYLKAKSYLLLGYFKNANFKLRKPKEKGIYSFRINKQFRALCFFKKGELRVFMIDNHQK